MHFDSRLRFLNCCDLNRSNFGSLLLIRLEKQCLAPSCFPIELTKADFLIHPSALVFHLQLQRHWMLNDDRAMLK